MGSSRNLQESFAEGLVDIFVKRHDGQSWSTACKLVTEQ